MDSQYFLGLQKKLITIRAMRSGLTKFLLPPTLDPCFNITSSNHWSVHSRLCIDTHTTVNGQERFPSSAGFTINKPLILSSASTIPNIWSTQLLLDGYYIHQMHHGGLQWGSSLGFSMCYCYSFQCSSSLSSVRHRLFFLSIICNLRHIPVYFRLYTSIINVSIRTE